MDRLIEAIYQDLEEITRYEKETGRKSFGKFDISKYVTDTTPPKYAFTMVSVPKVGINPQTSYNTPAGVYFYPLNQEYYNYLIEDELPFASKKEYVGVVELKNINSDKWMKFIKEGESSKTEKDVIDLLKKMGIAWPPKNKEELKARIKTQNVKDDDIILLQPGWWEPRIIRVSLKHWDFSEEAKMYDLTWWLSHRAEQDVVSSMGVKSGNPTFTWNKLLRDLGFIGVYDSGNSIIHPSEPTQLVALTPGAYKVVGLYPTADIRKTDIPSPTSRAASKLAKKKGLPEEVYMKLATTGDLYIQELMLKDRS
jgi:hypothetical protein